MNPRKLIVASILIAGLAFAPPEVKAQDPANGAPLLNAGAPSAGTSEVQTLTIGGTPSGGTFKLRFDGLTSAAITWSGTNATLLANIQAALNGLPNLENGEATAAAGTLTAGVGTVTITFSGNRAVTPLNAIEIANNSLTGTAPTLAVTRSTPGVRATGRGAAKGRLLIDTTNAKLYINTGTPLAPTWAVVGSQS